MPFNLILLVAAIQGVTEFLPISSSGHVALIPFISAHPYQARQLTWQRTRRTDRGFGLFAS